MRLVQLFLLMYCSISPCNLLDQSSKLDNICTPQKIANNSLIPVIKNYKITEVNCATNEAILYIEYFIPTDLTFNHGQAYDFGFEYKISAKQSLDYINEFRIRKMGLNNTEIKIAPNYYGGEVKITPFLKVKKPHENIIHGDIKSLAIPKFELHDEYLKTTISIKQEKTKDCNSFNQFSLIGFCGSPNGCKIISTPQVTPKVPYGIFEIPLVIFNNSILAKIQSILPEGQVCRSDIPITAGIKPATVNSPITFLGNNYWSNSEDCNCFKFELDIGITPTVNQTFTFLNHPNNPDGTKVYRRRGQSAELCIVQDGLHCISVIDQNDCKMDFCTELNTRNLNISAFNIAPVKATSQKSSNGEVIIVLDPSIKGPIKWGNIRKKNPNYWTKLKGKEFNIVKVQEEEKNDTKFHISGLMMGEYYVKVTDANKCAKEVSFKVNLCSIDNILHGWHIGEKHNHLGNDKQVIFSVIPKFTNMVPTSILGSVLDQFDFTWTLPDGSTTKGIELIPKQAGKYQLDIIGRCRRSFAEKEYLISDDIKP